MNRVHKPEVFRLDDPAIVVMPAAEPRRPAGTATGKPLADGATARVPAPSPRPARRVPWATIFWGSAAGLLLLSIALGIANLIADCLAARLGLAAWVPLWLPRPSSRLP